MKQQSGRIGRCGEKSLDVTLIFPQKGQVNVPKIICNERYKRKLLTGLAKYSVVLDLQA